jgi:hypothetical protein
VISLQSAESLHEEYKSVETVESQVAERQEPARIPEVLSEQSASEINS